MEKVTHLAKTSQSIQYINLDKEWVNLIAQAKTLGITKDEIREFLRNQ